MILLEKVMGQSLVRVYKSPLLLIHAIRSNGTSSRTSRGNKTNLTERQKSERSRRNGARSSPKGPRRGQRGNWRFMNRSAPPTAPFSPSFWPVLPGPRLFPCNSHTLLSSQLNVVSLSPLKATPLGSFHFPHCGCGLVAALALASLSVALSTGARGEPCSITLLCQPVLTCSSSCEPGNESVLNFLPPPSAPAEPRRAARTLLTRRPVTYGE